MIYEKRRKLSLNHWVISSFHNNFLRVKKGTTSKLLTYLLFWNNNVPGSLPRNQTHPTHTEGLPKATYTQYHWHLSDFYLSAYQWWSICILLYFILFILFILLLGKGGSRLSIRHILAGASLRRVMGRSAAARKLSRYWWHARTRGYK